MKKQGLVLAAGLFLAAISGTASTAQEFPEKPVTIMVNYGAGGGVDLTARSVQRFLPDALGQSVVVENHPGAGGKIGIIKFLEAPRDGYTILTAFAPATTVVRFQDPDIFENDELAIINMQWADEVVIVANKETGWENLGDMIEAVRAEPGKYSFGSSGRGSAGPIMAEILFDALDLDVKIVPYAGGGKTRAALQGGHVDMIAGGNTGMVPVADSLNMIGVFWDEPVPEWPGGMTVNDQLAAYDVNIPTAAAYRFHAVHRDVKENYPERFDALVEAFRQTTLENEDFKTFSDAASIRRQWLGPEASQALIDEVDARFWGILEESWN